MMKMKVFAWLLLFDRLNIKDLLKRHQWNVTEDSTCVLCHSHAYEDRVPLFFECKFSTRVWSYLQVEWIATEVDMQRILGLAKKHFGLPFFMEVLITACWNIWLIRNAKVFRQEQETFARWKGQFVHDMTLLQYRINAKHKDSLLKWIRSLP
jgi:hypothetical protein